MTAHGYQVSELCLHNLQTIEFPSRRLYGSLSHGILEWVLRIPILDLVIRHVFIGLIDGPE